MRVLLSIKPKFAFKIFNGVKLYEYRKAIFRNSNVSKIIVYASSPVKKVIGEFEIENIIYDELDRLWELTSDLSGISEDYFYDYFSSKNKGYAIKVKNTKLYKSPFELERTFKIRPPQSFAYV